jgi:GT2 family glycosyltransferase
LVKVYYLLAMPVYFIIGYMATGGNFAIKKEVLNKMGGFDTNISFYGEDTNLARRAYQHGKVKFKPSFVMHTSGRRFTGDGFMKTTWQYVVNFFSEVFRHKPSSKDYTDIR